jgi:NTE family protein
MSSKSIALALQGGGSHGAFTWGVLDRFLEDGRLHFDAISGASAGALNAAILAHGFIGTGRDGAREALKTFWDGIANDAMYRFLPDPFYGAADLEAHSRLAPAMQVYVSLARFFAPDQLNPLGLNPLRELLANQIDFERLRAHSKIDLFISATQVRTGAMRLFRTRELTLDALLASACLPSFHHTVKIDGEAYWDGGLTANPPLFPLVHQCAARDVVMVLLHPFPHDDIPETAEEISHRLAEIGFNAAFFAELQGLALARNEARQSLFAFGRLERKLRGLKMHLVDAPDLVKRLSTPSKLNTNGAFIRALFDAGRARGEVWLTTNFEAVGKRATFELS